VPCGSFILDTIIRHNLLVDKKYFDSNAWHFNRRIGERPEDAIRAYKNLLSVGWSKIGDWLANPDTYNCMSALQTFGELTHAWQDFYAHAIPRNQNCNEPIGRIGGSPDAIPNGTIPSSWGGILTPGEHGWSEPGLRAVDYYERRRSTVTFTSQKLQLFLPRFVASCRCHFKEMF